MLKRLFRRYPALADIDGLAWAIVAIVVLFWAVAVGAYAGGAWGK